MRRVVLDRETDWDGWRKATRALVLAGVAPEQVHWSVRTAADATADALPEASGGFTLSRALVAMAALAFQARAQDRFGLLYRLVWRANAGGALPHDDPDWRQAQRLALAVRAEAHKMRTNLRFLQVEAAAGTDHVSWSAPAHFVLEANAQLLVRRFPQHRLAILTPDGSALWDGTELRFGLGLAQVADDADLETWWRDHHAMLWHDARAGTSIPEAEALDEAPRAPDRPPVGPVVLPLHADPGLLEAAREAGDCTRCPLHEPATQTVFGEGSAEARAMFIGEQPGDQEDVIGRPFVGPAGQLLDRALEEAGIDRRTIYVTNAVKHFKFSPRGKRRIHQPPDAAEIAACRFWLDVERVRLRPGLLVLMGGSAARAVLHRPVTITRERGRPIRMEDGQTAFVTVHPSYLLRIPDADGRAREYRLFVRDLEAVRQLIEAL